MEQNKKVELKKHATTQLMSETWGGETTGSVDIFSIPSTIDIAL